MEFQLGPISEEEARGLLTRLPAYYQHMQASPNSLLALYCGLYQAAGHWYLLLSNFARGHLAFNEVYELKV